MMLNSNCPGLDTLRALVDEILPADEQLAWQAHVENCADCQKSLEQLVAGSESWDAAVAHARDPVPQVEDPTLLADAVRRMKSHDADAAGSPFRVTDYLEPSDQPGSLGRLGNYEVTEVVGQGGMGVVMKAFDPVLHRVVAVKVLAPYLANNPQARKRFIREAQAIAAVCHDHVITIHAIDESEEQPKIVMQYIAGRSLQQKIDTHGSLDVKEILRIGLQTAAGLAAAHAQGLVHRDVKPSNILLENGVQRVKLTDFGLARAVDDASLTQSGVIAGTPQYMAPEQANGDTVDARADLFSLGSVMYAMCVGHSPFRASTTMGVLKRVCHDAPRPIQELNPEIPDWLCDIVMTLLAKDPAQRFQTARELADLLEKWLAHLQQPAVVPRPRDVECRPSTGSRTAGMPPGDSVNSHTIFFQQISGRWLLFFLLSGMAGFLVLGRTSGMQTSEMLLMSLMVGLMIAFWGMLLLSLGRFIGANVMGLARWLRSEPPPVAADLKKPVAQQAGPIPPESLAMAAAIVAILLKAGPLIAAIIAIIVWRVASGKMPSLSRFVSTRLLKSAADSDAGAAKK